MIFFTNNPNLKKNIYIKIKNNVCFLGGRGWVGGGARVSDFFYKIEGQFSKSKITFFF